MARSSTNIHSPSTNTTDIDCNDWEVELTFNGAISPDSSVSDIGFILRGGSDLALEE